MHLKRVLLVACGLVVSCVPAESGRQDESTVSDKIGGAPEQVGELITEEAASVGVEVITEASGPQLIWSRSFRFGAATYIAVHFSHFDLPPGAHVVVRGPEGGPVATYTNKGKALSQGSFWARHVRGDHAIVELFSTVPVAANAVMVDHFSRGYQSYEMQSEIGIESICGSDDSQWARCYEMSEPMIYDKSRAVARLLINGSSACTGWLVGNEGHLMTNQHCIGDAATAANTDYEFMAEGSSCGTSCSSFGACPGTVEADTATLISVDAPFDYALVRLPNNVSTTYGFFQLRPTGAVVNERIYISGHPAAWGKRFSVTAEGSPAQVTTLTAGACSNSGFDVGYQADTQGGSSGSPVIAYSDHLVVALHHCGGCPNLGVPIQDVINDLGSLLPPSALPGGGCTPQAVANAGADRSICPGQSVNLGTPALADHTYSWSSGQTTAEISVSPNVTTTYTLTAETSCGTAEDSVTVSVGASGSLTTDFEGDVSGWATTGFWHLVNGSACGAPGYSSPTRAMYFGQDVSCTFNNNARVQGELTSPEFGPVDAAAVLRFDYFRQVESDAGQYDRAEVQASADGTNWTTLWTRNSANPSENAWTASGDISLAAFAGQTIRIRFRFDSVDGVANGFTGWMVDDVEVTGQTCGPINTAPTLSITAPADGSTFDNGVTVTLNGSATDAEDGNISANIAWSSDLDGTLGNGASLSRVFSVGTHVISASVMDSGGLSAMAQISITIRPPPSNYLENFESGATGWTVTGLWHNAENSACASPGYSSATHAMYFGRDATCNYSNGSRVQGLLTSPDLSNITAASVLRFQYFRVVESFNGNYDRTVVEISNNGGSTWTALWTRNSTNPSTAVWTSSGDISLSAYAGQTIRLRFNFDSRDSTANNFTGWFVDDVEIR